MESWRPSRRPQSAIGRPSSRFNPITGEEYEAEPPSKPERAEQHIGVPTLNLGNLQDNDPRGRKPAARGTAPIIDLSDYTPMSTGRSDYQPQTGRSTTRTVADSARLDSARMGSERSARIDASWISAPYHAVQQERIHNAAEREAQKKEKEMIETMMMDQLSRGVISDPEQDSGREVNADDLYHVPGQSRGQIHRLHQSKVKTTGSSTEQLLSQRVRFGARILTRVGCDAVRELSGFFFVKENSLTIYQYKKLGKGTKVLPLIQRGTYNHMSGRKRGLPYTLSDISVGSTLLLPVNSQPMLPESARSQPCLFLRVTEVDDDAKAAIVLAGVAVSHQEKVWNDFHRVTPEEQHDRLIIKRVQEKILQQISKRSVKSYTGLSNHFRHADRSGDGLLDRFELQNALRDFHIQLTNEEFTEAWTVVDENNDGAVDYAEFRRHFVGEMSERRKSYVRKAFQKMDTSNKGEVSNQQLSRFFNAAKHPLVQTGATSKVLLTEQFLSSWTHCQDKELITYTEFEDYYEGLSISVEDDEDFINIVRNCWGV